MPRDSAVSDETTTVGDLRRLVAGFVEERDWRQFHLPKNVAMSIAIEAAELMEHFQWIEAADSRRVADDPDKLAEIGEELADVVAYCLALANELDLDLSQTLHAKMAKNVRKYPADEFRGRWGRGDAGR